MQKGVPILDTVTKPCKVTVQGRFVFKIILTQGLNRQIRRMCEYFGYEVTKLKRTRIMNVALGTLKPGQWRDLTRDEMGGVNKAGGGAEKKAGWGGEGERGRVAGSDAGRNGGDQQGGGGVEENGGLSGAGMNALPGTS